MEKAIDLSLRGRFAPVAISQYLAGLWESCRRNRNCLHEIATSASGLLAMTNLWPSLFYRQPVRIGSNAPGPAVRSPACQKSPFGPFSPSCFQNCKIEYCSILFCNSAAAAGYGTRKDTLTVSLYYRVVVFIAPIQGLCYTVRDAVDWFRFPTARRFLKGSNHSPLQYC